MRTARAAPLRLSGRGTHGLLQLHRRLLQSHPAALSSGVSLAHLLRTGNANRPTVRHPLNRPPNRGNFTLLDQLGAAYGTAERARPLVAVLDNGPIHRSKLTTRALAQRPWLTLEWLPKYAPE